MELNLTRGMLDRALSNLLGDLSDRGLLDETLVVLTTEFGRSPVINYNAGRDHHPAVFSALLAGGGIRGGQTAKIAPTRRKSGWRRCVICKPRRLMRHGIKGC